MTSQAKDFAVRYVLRLVFGAYLRVRVEGVEHLPRSSYLLCFNHPSWADPMLLVGFWPGARRLMIFGPREEDMSKGWRNALIRWTERGVPLKPGAADTGPVTRRVVSVLGEGQILAIAGEGRLSDREGEALPLQVGVGHLALLARVPVVPVGIVGTRWLRYGKTIRLRIGEPVSIDSAPRGRRGARQVTLTVQESLARLLAGAADGPSPGRLARWLSDAFNDRSWEG